MKADHALWYSREARVWEESLPLGNGRLGAMVFGGTAGERIALNEDTLWSGYPKDGNRRGAAQHYPHARDMALDGQLHEAQRLIEQKMLGAFTQSYLPLGDLWIDFPDMNAVEAYRRALSLQDAVCETTFLSGGVRHRREAFVSHPDQALYVRLEVDKPGALSFSCRLTSPIRHSVQAKGDRLAMRGVCPSNVVPSYIQHDHPIRYAHKGERKGMRFAALLQLRAEGGRVVSSGGQISVTGASSAVLRLCARTSFNGFDRHPFLDGRDEQQLAEADLLGATIGYAAARRRHVTDHRALYSRTRLVLEGGRDDLPTDERLLALERGQADASLPALLFHYGRYLLIASSRPGCQSANLQGIWNQHLRAAWSCNYTININTQMNYWPAECCNLPELHEPLFDLIRELQLTGAHTARTHYGARGAVAHHNTDLWRLSNPVGERHEGFAGCAFWPMSLGWLCGHLWMHYEYAPDPVFLRERVLPALRDCARFYLDTLAEDEEGHLTIAPATSPENVFLYRGGVCKVARSAQMTTSIVREVFGHYLDALDALAIEEEMANEVRAALPLLPDYRIGRDGQMLEWEAEYEEPEPRHRHLSHLYDLFPGGAITKDTPDLMDACRRSLVLRGDDGTGWSMGWKINLWARLGEGERALRLIRRMLKPVDPSAEMNLTDGGSYPNLMDAHPPFQIDGNLGACAGIAQMLLQSDGSVIDLLPALPAEWSGRVEGLRAKGGALVDIEFREGRLLRARVRLPENRKRPRVVCRGLDIEASQIEWV